MSQPLRVLGAIRLSRKTDESTSPERQCGRIEWWRAGQEADLAYITRDLDVSGKVSPFEREGLGPWLTDPAKIAQWDVLVVWKLDRVSRNALDTMHLLEWAKKHGKRIVCVDDSLDSGTKMGKMWMQMAAMFAEMELNLIEERTQASREELRQQGRWAGGTPPYGYRAIKVKFEDGSSGWKLEPDPVKAKVVKRMIQMIIDGASFKHVAETLDAEKVERPRKGSKRWAPAVVKKIATSPVVLWGKARHKGVTIEYVDYAQPLVDIKTVMDLEKAVAKRRSSSRSGVDSQRKLTGIAFCVCGEKFYAHPGKYHLYYRCAGRYKFNTKCPVTAIRADWLEPWLEDEFMRVVGGEEMLEQKVIPGEDHTAELTSVQTRIKKLAGMFEAGALDDSDTDFIQSLAALKSRRAELEKLPNRPDTVEWVPTGVFYSDVWDSYSAIERREYMISRGVRVELKEVSETGVNKDRVTFKMKSDEVGNPQNPRTEDIKAYAFA